MIGAPPLGRVALGAVGVLIAVAVWGAVAGLRAVVGLELVLVLVVRAALVSAAVLVLNAVLVLCTVLVWRALVALAVVVVACEELLELPPQLASANAASIAAASGLDTGLRLDTPAGPAWTVRIAASLSVPRARANRMAVEAQVHTGCAHLIDCGVWSASLCGFLAHHGLFAHEATAQTR